MMMIYEDLLSARDACDVSLQDGLSQEERDALQEERRALNEQIAASVRDAGDRLKAVNGDYFRIEGEELDDLLAREASWEVEKTALEIEAIRMECEDQIAAGILVNGQPFRADDASMQRVQDMVIAFDAGLVGPEGVQFRTAAGVDLTLSDVSHATAIRNALLRHRAACLAVSAALQSGADADWPIPQDVTIQ